MNPGLETSVLVHNLSRNGAIALKSVVTLVITAARSFLATPTTKEESSRLSQEFRCVADEDIYHVLDRASEIALKEFFQVELDRRKGLIACWVYQGMTRDHRPQFLTISISG